MASNTCSMKDLGLGNKLGLLHFARNYYLNLLVVSDMQGNRGAIQ